MKPRVQRQLKKIDWDFVNDDGGFATGLHWYPGTFVPSIPGALIEALTEEGQLVFDPYCGVGTTGIAATMRGRVSIQTDINPIALLSASAGMSLATLAIDDSRKLRLAFDILEYLLDIMDKKSSLVGLGSDDVKEVDGAIRPYCDQVPIFDVEEGKATSKNLLALEPWFDTRTLSWLTTFLALCAEKLDRGFLFLIAATMISSVVRALSSQTQSWGHIADNVRPKETVEKDPSIAMRRWISRTKGRFLKVGDRSTTSRPGNFSVIKANWAELIIPDGQLEYDLLVTSPPYAGAIDYTLAQRLSLYLFGWQEDELSPMVESEIGARRKRSKTTHIATWAEQVAATAALHAQLGNPSSHAAYVFPHKDSGRAIGEEAIIASMEKAGWPIELQVDRSIRQARTRQSWTSIKKETILIFGGP